MRLATARQMRELDRAAIGAGTPSMTLMDRAAEGVAQAVLESLPDQPRKCRAAIFCGAGNNGGDGIAAARLLFLKGVRVRVFLAGAYEKLTEDALEQTRRLSECSVELEPFDPESQDQRNWALTCQAVVDALLGVGLSRPVEPDSLWGRAMDLINACGGAVISADVPSGVDADTGRVLGMAVQADRTITFTLPKIGCFVGPGALLAGRVTVWEIGIPAKLREEVLCTVQTVEADYARAALPPRRADGHKGTFGKVLVAGGSVGYTGAPCLTGAAAERSGCGLVFLGVPASVWPVAAAKCAGAMPFPLAEREGQVSRKALPALREKLALCDVLALGPGLGRGEQPERTALALLEEARQPVVLDADGINALAGHIDILDARRGRTTILTPHDGEFARIGGDLTHGDRVRSAREFAAAHGCVLVLKGHRTVTATPEGNVLVNTTGNSGLAKGGSGDVLTGVIAGLLAQGATAVQAAALGVWLHGRAGDRAAERLTAYAMTAEDVLAELPGAFLDLTGPV